MAILTATHATRVQLTCPSVCFYAEHDGSKVLRRGEGTLTTFRSLICATTSAEVDAEIARLALAPLALTNRQKAAAFFQSLDPAIQQQFASVFQAVNAIPKDADAAAAVAAVVVPDNLKADQAQLVALIQGQAS